MQLTISHKPNYHSYWAVVDLNHSVREKLRPDEVLTTDRAIETLKEVKKESSAKASKIILVITLICLAVGPSFAAIAAIMGATPLTMFLIMALPIGLTIFMEKLKIFPFSLLEAYHEQAMEAEYGHIIKLKDKYTYNITSDIVLL